LAAARLGISVTDKNRTYEFEQWITTPEYRTDAARAIDAYERLMERYMDLAEGNLLQVGGDCQAVAIKLDSLDLRLTEISDRLTRIEKALGIDPNGNPVPPKTNEPRRTIKSR
jgi:hypothetical protein